MKYLFLVLLIFLLLYLVKRSRQIKLFQKKVKEAQCPLCESLLGDQDFSKTFCVKPSLKGSDTSGYFVQCQSCKENFRLTYGGRIMNEKIEILKLIH